MTAASSTHWLLDTNIISHAVRYPHGPVAKQIQRLSIALTATLHQRGGGV